MWYNYQRSWYYGKKNKEKETLLTILLIAIYVVVNSYLMQNFGYTSLQSFIANTIISILIIALIISIKRENIMELLK